MLNGVSKLQGGILRELWTRIRAYYPFGFGVFPIVSLVQTNLDGVYWRDAVIAVVAMIAIVLGMWLCMRPVLPDRDKRAIIVTGFVALFWGCAPTLDWVRSTFDFRASLSTGQLVGLALLSLIALAGPMMGLRKTTRSLVPITQLLSIIALIVVILPLSLIFVEILQRDDFDTNEFTELQSTPIIPDEELGNYPDVVLIVADMYGRHDIIQKYYDLDNTEFLEALEDRGFYIARESWTNYNYTRDSLPSLLNYMYLDGIAEGFGGSVSLDSLVQDNRITRYFENKGYEIVSFATGEELTEMRDADRYLAPELVISEFTNTLLNNTALRFFMNRMRSWKRVTLDMRHVQYDLHRERIRFALNGLKILERKGKPMFVFVHVLFPHHPFVFDASGANVYPETRYIPASFPTWENPTPEEFIKGYRDQVIASNTMFLESIDALQERSPNTIIVLMGDHGPRLGKLMNYYGEGPTKFMDEEFGILNAIYLPGVNTEEILYPDVSPVNTFRIILNTYFDESLELLEDRSTYVDYRSFDSQDVTRLLRDGAEQN